MKKTILASLLLLILFSSLASDELALGASGRFSLLHDDGSFDYVEYDAIILPFDEESVVVLHPDGRYSIAECEAQNPLFAFGRASTFVSSRIIGLFRMGQMEVLQPLIGSGKIKIVADQWVENWDPYVAKKLMENILIATGKKFDAVVASNDGTALGALEAMKVAGLAGKVPISGQDATEAGCNSIARGELTVTILKDIRSLTPLACDLAVKLAKNEVIPGLQSFSLAELTGDRSMTGDVPCKFPEVFQVTKDKLKRLVVDSGFQTYEGVYEGIENAPKK